MSGLSSKGTTTPDDDDPGPAAEGINDSEKQKRDQKMPDATTIATAAATTTTTSGGTEEAAPLSASVTTEIAAASATTEAAAAASAVNTRTEPAAPATPGERKKTADEIKAEARAYALSSATKKKVPLWRQQQKMYQKQMQKAAVQNAAALAYHHHHTLVVERQTAARQQPQPPQPLSGTAEATTETKAAADSMTKQQQQHPQQPQQQQPHYHSNHMQIYQRAHPYMLQPPPPAAAIGEAVSHSAVLAQLTLQTKQPGHSNGGDDTSNNNNNTSNNAAGVLHPTTTVDELLNDKNLDDYTRFVKALSVEDSWEMFLGDDEEEDYQLDPKEDEDDEDDDGDEDEEEDDEENDNGDNDEDEQGASSSKRKKVTDSSTETTPATTSTTTTAPMSTTPIKVVPETDGENANQQDTDDKAASAASPAAESTSSSSASDKSSPSSPSFNFPDWDAAVYEELEQELGWLEEEDMEAAVATLLDNHPRKKTDDEQLDNNNNINSPLPSTLPLPFPAMITNHYFEAPPSGPDHMQVLAGATGHVPGHSTQPGITATTAASPGTATASVKPFSTSFSPSEILPQRSKRPPVRGGLGRGAAAAAASSRNMPSTTVTQAQHAQLKDLMHKHYQLLMQQAVLSVRAAHYHKYNRSRMDRLDRTDFISGGETADDMAEILDAACGMLQDLDQNRKDSIRHFMQFHHHQSTSNSTNHKKRQHHHLSTKPMTYAAPQGRAPRSLFADEDDSDEDDMGAWGESRQAERRLTRAQFNKSLQEQNPGRQSESVFDIQGLCNLGDTFATLDKSVIQSDASEAALPPAKDRHPNQTDGKSTDAVAKDKEDASKNREEHLLEIDSTEKACLMVLKKANVKYDERLVPGARDVSDNFVDPREFFGPTFKPPCSKEEELLFRRNRNLFTAAEDNLVLRGVNLFGEKQWLLIADRFMPDRSINIISQRYSKLCLMLYKANGIKIDESGNLEIPPRFENFEDIPRSSLRTLRPVNPPTVFNVHRWSLEEDLTLLKAVPKMGHMWAELGARLIPHRDRGHLRKRYQVLERRIKAATTRSKKFIELKGVKAPAPKGPVSRSAAPRENTVAVATQESRRTKLAPTTPAHVRPPPIHAHSPPTTFAHLSSPVHAYARSPPHAYPPPPHAHALSPQAYPHAPYPYHPHYMYAAPHYPHLYSPGYPPPPYSPTHHVSYPYVYPPPGYLPPAQPSPPAPAPSVRPPVPPATLRESAPKATVEFKDLESGSRAAFERLSQESQWSQMSDMLADDTLLVASAMATDLARGPAKGAVNARTAATPVTASVKATDASEKGTASNDVTDSTSFLAGVLERVGGGGGRGGETPSKRARLSSSNDTSKQDGVFPETPTGLSPPPLQASPPSTSVSISSLAQGSSHRIFAGTPGKSLFGENATLMENDLEAISALNLLGNSPATLNGSERKASDAGIAPAPRKSLFAQVVEGSTTMASPAPAPLPLPPRQSKKRNLQF